MSPFEAVYNKKPSFGVYNLGIPHELWILINTEDDLNIFQKEVCEPAAAEVVQSEFSTEGEDEFVYPSPNLMVSQETQFLSKYPHLIDEYEKEICHPYHLALSLLKTHLHILIRPPSRIIVDHFHQVQLKLKMN